MAGAEVIPLFATAAQTGMALDGEFA